MRKLIFTTTLLTFACAKEVREEVASTPQPQTAQTAKPAEPTIKEIGITSANPEAIEQFKKGRDLAENVRRAEAMPYFNKAIELDPNFALAHAYLGHVTPGAAGAKELETALTMAANLPEDERTLIEALAAERRGEAAKTAELRQKLVQLAPTDWRAHEMAGTDALHRRDLEAATASFTKAIELNPNVGTMYNHLGYVLLMQGKKDEAIAAFRKYAELSPSEPNPHDSLADALLAAAKLEEAEASYLKATEVSPAFSFAWNGVAATRALRGNWAGAEEALAKYRESSSTPEDKLHAAIDLAWYRFAQGKTKEALTLIDEVEKQAQTDKIDMIYATVPLHRAAMFIETNKAKDALKLVATGMERAEKAALPGELMAGARAFALHVRAIAEWKLGKKDDLAKTAAAFDEEVKKNPSSAKLVSALHDIQGMAAIATGDAKGAVEHFGSCLEDDSLCAYHRVEVEEKAGNKAGADSIRERVAATPVRDAKYIYVRTKLGTIPST